MKLFNKNSGQSLVELIVAITVIEIGLFSVWSMFLVNFNAEREAQMRVLGANLAREGVELVKNVRDSNWLKVNANVPKGEETSELWSWDQNLEPGSYNLDATNIIDGWQSVGSENRFQRLYLNSDGFYSVSGASSTPYERAITLKDICCDSSDSVTCSDTDYSVAEDEPNCTSEQLKIGVKVVSEVRWIISGNQRNFKVELNLYNWQ